VKRVDRKWRKVKIGAVLIGLLFLTTACGAKWHLNRAIAKDPTILDRKEIVLDTIVITENKLLTDTLVLREYDTIKIEKDGVRVSLNRLYDTIQVEVECPPDTIKISKVVEVPQVVYQPKKFNKIHLLLWIISFFLYTLAIIKLYNR